MIRADDMLVHPIEQTKLELRAQSFELPPALEAGEPIEARGLPRDLVRLLVTRMEGRDLRGARFRDLASFLSPGDLLVINTSATRAAALPARRADGSALRLHLSTRQDDGSWIVELRRPDGVGSRPFGEGEAGETLRLPAGASAQLLAPHRQAAGRPPRLWRARVSPGRAGTVARLQRLHGQPIRYKHARSAWPLAAYQTLYQLPRRDASGLELASAEMPSAGRAFTPELIARLVARGIRFAPLELHTGVASLEANEPPFAERFAVPRATAEAVNAARAAGRRVVAVGTSSVRALESSVDERGLVQAREGWTELVIGPDHRIRTVDGLITGFHEPEASHLAMLQAVAGRRHVERAYRAALAGGYRWHEFGDLHLILR